MPDERLSYKEKLYHAINDPYSSNDPWLFMAEMMARRDYITCMSEAWNEGFQEGKFEKAVEFTRENAIELMRNGAPLELISKSLKISKDELLQLASENNISISE